MAYQHQAQKSAQKSGISYSDAVNAFNSPDVQDDINNACDRLVLALSAMVQRFDSITKQMHTIDLLRFNCPMTPKWTSMRQVSQSRVQRKSAHVDSNKPFKGSDRAALAVADQRWRHIWPPEA
jgi:hypothetical protein